jgi:Family of unknown function (DUF5677)
MGIQIDPNPTLTTNFPHQLHIAKQLMEYAEHVTTTAKPEDDISKLDFHRKSIVIALGGKAFRTFNAVVDLAEKGHADDAASLNRVLYECALVAAYLLDAPTQTVEDYSDYAMYRNWRDHKLFSEVDPSTAVKAFTADTLKEMEAQFNLVAGRYPDGRWTSLTVETMAREVDDKLPKGFRVFTFTYGATYRQASAYVHSDVRSIQSSFITPGFIQRVVTPEELGKFLYLANFLMVTLCFVIFGSLYGGKFTPEHNAICREWHGVKDAAAGA